MGNKIQLRVLLFYYYSDNTMKPLDIVMYANYEKTTFLLLFIILYNQLFVIGEINLNKKLFLLELTTNSRIKGSVNVVQLYI